MPTQTPWEITSEFLSFLNSLDPFKRHVAIEAIKRILLNDSLSLHETDWLVDLGAGLFEFRIGPTMSKIQTRANLPTTFRISQMKSLLRVFCVFRGANGWLLIWGYDKAADSSRLRQKSEITFARNVVNRIENAKEKV